jgi:hypothetical protein
MFVNNFKLAIFYPLPDSTFSTFLALSHGSIAIIRARSAEPKSTLPSGDRKLPTLMSWTEAKENNKEKKGTV